MVLVATGAQPRAVYLRRSCAGAGAGTEQFGGTTIACAVSRGGDPARVDLTLEPGSYFVFVEALGDGPRGKDFYEKPDGELLHLQNWVAAIRDGKTPSSPVEAAVNAAAAAHLANKALRSGGVAKAN